MRVCLPDRMGWRVPLTAALMPPCEGFPRPRIACGDPGGEPRPYGLAAQDFGFFAGLGARGCGGVASMRLITSSRRRAASSFERLSFGSVMEKNIAWCGPS